MGPRPRTSLALVTLIALTCIGACGSDDDTTEVATTDEAPVDDTAAATTSQAAPMSRAELAVDDLAAHLGIDADQVEVVSEEAVTWSNSSLGCPEEGFLYQQVLTDGFRIVLDVDGTRYQYHSGEMGDPFRCDDPQEPASVG